MLIRLQLRGAFVRLSAIAWGLSQNIAYPRLLGIDSFGDFVRLLALIFILAALVDAVVVPLVINQFRFLGESVESNNATYRNLKVVVNDVLLFAIVTGLLFYAFQVAKFGYGYPAIAVIILLQHCLLSLIIGIAYARVKFLILASGFWLATVVQLLAVGMFSSIGMQGAIGGMLATIAGLAAHTSVLLTSSTIRRDLSLTFQSKCFDTKSIRHDYFRLISAKLVQIFSFAGVLFIFSINAQKDAIGDLKLAQTVVSAGSQAIPVSQEAFQVWVMRHIGSVGGKLAFWIFIGTVFACGTVIAGLIYSFGHDLLFFVFLRNLQNFSGLYVAIPFVIVSGLLISRLYAEGHGVFLSRLAVILIVVELILSKFVGPIFLTVSTLIGFVGFAMLYLAYYDVMKIQRAN
ncbi:MAG: hypothetical protein K9J74_04585 [Sulfuritalea sp.]|nr:hypothetical protein [Sulfuritalea sp.]